MHPTLNQIPLRDLLTITDPTLRANGRRIATAMLIHTMRGALSNMARLHAKSIVYLNAASEHFTPVQAQARYGKEADALLCLEVCLHCYQLETRNGEIEWRPQESLWPCPTMQCIAQPSDV